MSSNAASPSSASSPSSTEIELAITGMTCASCVARVEKKLNNLPGVTAVVNLATEKARVELTSEASDIDESALISTVERAGYGAILLNTTTTDETGARIRETSETAKQAEKTAAQAAQDRVHDLRRRFYVSLLLSFPIVGISMLPSWQFPGWQWLVGALSLPVAFWGGWPFLRAAARAGRHGATTMDTLVALGIITSMGWSTWALLCTKAGDAGYTMKMTGIHGLGHTDAPHLYFESAAFIVTFLLLGRWLESRSRRIAGDALRSLLELGAPTVTRVEQADGTILEETIPTKDLRVGDVFLVRPGETVATDGVVIEGKSAVDASLLTGESTPVDVGIGSQITGATVNSFGVLRVRATRVGEDTTLSRMGRLLTEAQTGKAPVQRLADRISSFFVPAVIAIALATFTLHLLLAHPVEMALASAITVLVVACPCALGLATPTALLVGSGRASRLGILMKGPEILESAHAVDTIIMDKTGTLTTGIMSVAHISLASPSPLPGLSGKPTSEQYMRFPDTFTSVDKGISGQDEASRQELLTLVSGLEKGSEHPIAQAIVAFAEKSGVTPAQVTEVSALPGKGITGKYQGKTALAGSPEWITSQGVTNPLPDGIPGTSTVAVALDDRILGCVSVGDTVRTEAKEAVDQLKKQGITPILVTGDNEGAATTAASSVGIDTVHAGVLPEGKLAILEDLRASGHRVAMVGDGVNDAAALAAADLSIAMGSGTDVAKAASDITIITSDIRSIPASLRISHRTLRVIKENLAWAFGYNLVAIPLAVFGFIVPGIAAAAMASSSVIVVGNSLRLRR